MAKFTLLEEERRAIANNIILRDQLLYDIYLDTGGDPSGGSWLTSGNLLTETGIFGSMTAYDIDIYGSGEKIGAITKEGDWLMGVGPVLARQTIYSKTAENAFTVNTIDFRNTPFPDTCQGGSWNNTTDPFNIVVTFAAYPLLYQKCFANIYIKIDDEIMRCSLAWLPDGSHRNLTFERGVAGTTAAAHTDGALIKFYNSYAVNVDNEGRWMSGVPTSDEYLEIHIKEATNAGVSIYRDDVIQNSNGDYGVIKTTAPYKGICQIFLCETGGIMLSGYGFTGHRQDPEDALHIGRWHTLEGGIMMDAAQACIRFRGANVDGGVIECATSPLLPGETGWLKLFGDNPIFDVSGKRDKPLRIGGCWSKNNGLGLSLIGYTNLPVGGESWDTLVRINNNTSGPCNLELCPLPATGNIIVAGQAAVSGTFINPTSITVTKGIITAIS